MIRSRHFAKTNFVHNVDVPSVKLAKYTPADRRAPFSPRPFHETRWAPVKE